MTIHKYYNVVTGQIIEHITLRNMYDISFPSNQFASGVDLRLEPTDPPNPFIITYPTLADWYRLEQDDAPVLPFYEKSVLNTPVYTTNSYKGKYTQGRTTVNKDLSEMDLVNKDIQNYLKSIRESKLSGEVIDVDSKFFFKAEESTIRAANDIKEYLLNSGEDATVSWKGEPEEEEGLSRWEEATVIDAQNISLAAEAIRQKAFTAERITMQEQLNRLEISVDSTFGSYEEIMDFYNDIYDNL